MRRHIILPVLLAALSIRTALVSGQLPSAWATGIATNYGGAQDGMDPSTPSFGTLAGSCGYGRLSPDVYPYWSVGALSLSNSFSLAGPSHACGQCFEVQCANSGGQFAGRCSSSQSIIITITDSCPECEANHLDIQALTFNRIAPMAIGRIDIRYRRVDCTPPNPVSIEIDSNVGVGGWLRLVVEKTAGFGGIRNVQMRTAGTQSWLAMENKFGSAWEISNAPSLPWDFQFTSDSSQTIQALSLVMQNGQIGNIPTAVQFSLSGSAGQTNISFDSATPPGASATPPQAAATPPGTPVLPPPAGAAATPPAASGPPAAGCCQDVQPPVPGQSITCQQQKDYGKCSDAWMVNGNFCQLTCGHCPASCTGGTAVPPGAAGAAAASGPPATPPAAAATPPAAAATPPAAAATPPAAAGQPPPAAGATPPASGVTPPAAGGQPPPATGATPPAVAAVPPPLQVQSGSVQTLSVGSTPPAAAAASPPPPAAPASPPPPPASPPPGGDCTDVQPPGGQSCAALANPSSCSSTIGAGYCSRSCYRAPCPSGG